MIRYILLTLLVGFCCASNVTAQGIFKQFENEFRQQGRQIVQEFGQEFRGRQHPQPGQPGQPTQNSYGSSSIPSASGRSNLPSEGGPGSGGNGRGFNPGLGFILPENGGGQQFQPSPIVQPGPQQGFPGYPGQNYSQQMNPGGQFFYSENPGFGPGIQSNPGIPSNVHYPEGKRFDNGGIGTLSPGSIAPGSPVMSSQFIIIRCPQTTNGSISYTLHSNETSHPYTMSGGQMQHFGIAGGWTTISFNDGAVNKRYRLEGGKIYTMKRDPGSVWQLFAAK